MSTGPSRRDLFRTSAAGAALGLAAAPARSAESNIYTRMGVRPFIEPHRHLHDQRRHADSSRAQFLGVECGIVTAGRAAALAYATAACLTGGDPEKMQQLPRLDGLKNEVIMPRQSRNVYDHAIRSTGVRMIEIDSPEEFRAALGERTAMVAVLGTGEAQGKIRLEEIAQLAHAKGVPVLVDAAAELPARPNPYISRGADLVAYSGGKILRGPQCARLLLGRKNLVRAAWVNSAAHHAFGRAMKVGKEEIWGMLAAIDSWMNRRNIQAEYRTWESWLNHIGEQITRVPGVRTKLQPPAGASPFPVLDVAWDPEKIAITAGEEGRLLLSGEPRIMSHAEGEGYSFVIRPVTMKPEHYKMVAQRLYDVFRDAPKPGAVSSTAPPASVEGVDFVDGSSRHKLVLKADGTRVKGTHYGRSQEGALLGTVDGSRVRLTSSLPFEGVHLSYTFTGTVSGDRMSGDVDLGEYGRAQWKARKAG